MTLHVLLVDDEYLVLKGLEIILKEQTEVTLDLIATTDASDALNRLNDFCPDVVIADINMPEIDGFSLIEQIKLRCPHCRFIICSGYDEQEYLRQALQLHVAEYLLKPVNKQLLIQRLKELAAEKEAKHANILLRIQLLLLQGQTSSASDLPNQELEYLFPHPSFCLCAVNKTDSVSEKITKQIAQYFDTLSVLNLNARTVFLINYPEKISMAEIRTLLSRILKDSTYGCSFFTAVPKKEAICSIGIRYQEALGELVFSLLPESDTIRQQILPALCNRTLFPAIRVITFEGNIETYIKDLYSKIDSTLCYPLVFTEIFAAYIMVSDISMPAALIRQLYTSHASDSCTKKGLIQFVKKILNFWYDSFSQSEAASCSSKVASACQYIELHYQEDLSLDQLAELLSVNPSYLSYIFKKESGSTLVQYLTNVRMQHACQLLQTNSELSLDEIALRAGYHSTTYFHKIFRAKYGVSPRQWQLSHPEPTNNK